VQARLAERLVQSSAACGSCEWSCSASSALWCHSCHRLAGICHRMHSWNPLAGAGIQEAPVHACTRQLPTRFLVQTAAAPKIRLMPRKSKADETVHHGTSGCHTVELDGFCDLQVTCRFLLRIPRHSIFPSGTTMDSHLPFAFLLRELIV
jgi:hypothetical protein